jgi:hypothetical protein
VFGRRDRDIERIGTLCAQFFNPRHLRTSFRAGAVDSVDQHRGVVAAKIRMRLGAVFVKKPLIERNRNSASARQFLTPAEQRGRAAPESPCYGSSPGKHIVTASFTYRSPLD